METIVYISFIVFLTIGSGFFSATESALFSLSSMKIKSYQWNPNPRLRLIANLVLKPRDLLVTVFMLNTLVNILLQNTISSYVGSYAGWLEKVGIPLFLTLVFGEIIPKYLGLVNNVSLSYFVAPIIDFLQRILSPIRRIIIAITAPISHLMFFFLKKESTISKEELQHVLRTSEQTGVLHSEEAELIDGYLNLQDTQVKELMRPREDVLFYDINEPLSKLTYLLVDMECTRVPVCDKNIDNVKGIISSRQFFLHHNIIDTPETLVKFLNKPLFIPETTPARMLIRRLDEEQEEMALVVDEYGSVTGLVTYEDLIEVVVGDISDRRDQNQMYTKSGENVIIASGKLELKEFEEVFEVELPNPSNMVTIGGWLTEQMGDIPKIGTKFETNEFFFQILGVDPNRITRVYIRKKEASKPANKTKTR